jgi:hypothetical protein
MSARGRRLPLIVVVLLLIGAAVAGFWLTSPGRADGSVAGGQLPLLSLTFNPAACPKAANIPAQGWDYPQAAATVEGWVARRNVVRTRVHGWSLWAALNQVVQGEPLWRNWCTSTQAYPYQYDPSASAKARPATGDGLASLGARRAALTAASDPSINLAGPSYPVPSAPARCVIPTKTGSTLRDGPSFANNTDILVAGVIYNPIAYASIVNQQLNVKKTLNGTPLTGPNRIGNVELAPGSVVLKPMMWPVKATGYTALPVWTGKQQDGGRYAGYERKDIWNRAVAVTPDRAGGPSIVKVQLPLTGVKRPDGTLWGANTYDAQVVGLDRFYAYKPDVGSLDPCDKAILDQSANAAYGRSFRSGDYLVMVAMHIATKEQPAWTFQSVYWSDRPNEGANSADRPPLPAARGPWRNYLMAATYGIPEASYGGRPPVWGVHFNPYIELAAGHPISTNCMNCHMRGAFVPTGSSGNATYLTTKNTDDPGPIGVLAPNNPIFADLVKTDFQWSLPNRAGTPPPPRRAGAGGAGARK